jgi:thiosulfate reductase cytochrome b subunit
MSDRIFILSLWIRLWHWTNALLIIFLVASGASLHFANSKLPLIPFELAARIHDIAGASLAALYVLFIFANMISGNWWQYVPKPGNFLKRCWQQVVYYCWGIFTGAPHPFPPTREGNFNPLQQIIYWFVMYLLMPTLIATGLIFLWPDFAPKRAFGMDGLLPIAMLHYLVAVAIVAFAIAHIYLATTGHRILTLFRMMITGWHVE